MGQLKISRFFVFYRFLLFLSSSVFIFFFAFLHYVYSEEISTHSENATDSSKDIPCGIIENLVGDVQVLDSERTHLLESSKRASLSCGSWIAVNHGWVQLSMQSGPKIQMGPQTLIQILDSHSGPQFQEDQILLFHGQIYLHSKDAAEEFRVVSANARARVNQGKLILVFNPEANTTQLVALENSAVLENRFEPSKKVQARAGESTELNFKLLRVIPSQPKAIAVASLRPRMAQLRIPEKEQFDAVRVVMERQGRHFASHLVKGNGSKPHEETQDRKLASTTKTAETAPKKSPSQYARHQASPEDPELRSRRIMKIAGGEQEGESILYPDKYYGNVQKVQLGIEDPSLKLKQKAKGPEDEEKKRLIEELSRIQLE